MTAMLLTHGASHPGSRPPQNLDAWESAQVPQGQLLVLCDGMRAGADASQRALRTIIDACQSSDLPATSLLPAALAQAHRAALQPGSTAVVALIADGMAHVAWVGTSRAYWMRDGTLMYSTASAFDRTSLGGQDDPQPHTLPHPWRLTPGDRVVLASDGVFSLIGDDELPERVRDLAPEHAARLVVELAARRGGQDSATAVVASWGAESFAAPPEGSADDQLDATEGFAPTRDSTPSPPGFIMDVDDEEDRATVLLGAHPAFHDAELLPPTPAPAEERAPAEPPPLPQPHTPPAAGGSRNLLLVGVGLVVVVGGLVAAYSLAR